MEETINRGPVDNLMELNCFDPRNFAHFKRGDVETPDLEKLGTLLEKLFLVGFVGPESEKLKQKIYDLANLPYEAKSEAAQTAEGVKTADQLIAEHLPTGLPGAAEQGGAPGERGGVKTADQLVAEHLPGGLPSAQAQPGAPAAGAPTNTTTPPGASPAVAGVAVPADTKLADTAMNGAQLAGMLAVVQAVTEGTIPRDSGIAQLQIGFRLSVEDAEKVMGSAGAGFKPTPAAPTTPFGGPKPPGAPTKGADDIVGEHLPGGLPK
jgi:hypothetical protein